MELSPLVAIDTHGLYICMGISDIGVDLFSLIARELVDDLIDTISPRELDFSIDDVVKPSLFFGEIIVDF